MTTRAQLSADEEYGHGHTSLMRAALDGNTERVKKLIHQGAGINQRDDNGRTALMFAVINAHYETMKVLLEYGADVSARSSKGGTALMGAALAVISGWFKPYNLPQFCSLATKINKA